MRPTLDCQTCGAVVRELTAAQVQQVADRPYDFIVYCAEHSNDWKHEARRAGLLP